MESKDNIKRMLKDAKESIKNKDYKNALRLCKLVLKGDRTNYMALVLFGAAIQETEHRDQAPNAFKKAAEVSPDQPLAWQGLISYYEKTAQETNEADLLNAYKHLIPIETDTKKKLELCEKLGTLAIKLHQSQVCIEILSSFPNDSDDVILLQKCMTKTLVQFKDLSSEQTLVLEGALEKIVDSNIEAKVKFTESKDDYHSFLKLLYRNGKAKVLLNRAIAISEIFENDLYPLEWMGKVWVEFVAEEKDVSFVKNKIEVAIQRLCELGSKSSVSMAAKGALHFSRREFVQARDELNNAISSYQAPWHVYFLSAKNYMMLSCPSEAENILLQSESLLKRLSSTSLQSCQTMFQKLYAEALSFQQENNEKLGKAVQICEELLSSNPTDGEVHLIKCRALIALNEFQDAKKQLAVAGPSHERSFLEACLLSKMGEYKNALSFLESLAEETKFADIFLEIYAIREKLGEQANQIATLIEAARCDPYCWRTFLYLGKEYEKLGAADSLDKAKRCYQKALSLNPKSDESGERLSETLTLLKETDANLQLLTMMTKTTNKKWAWIRLGLVMIERGDTDQAITSFCNAIRRDPGDNHTWEVLGDTYMLRGAWNAAKKSFQRALDIAPEDVYPAYQIAVVKLRMGQYQESLTDFGDILEKNPEYIPALHGQGEAALLLAQFVKEQHRLKRAQVYCQVAIDSLTAVLTKKRNFSCTWKMLADACVFGAQLPELYSEFEVPVWLSTLDNQTDFELNSAKTRLKKMALFVLAERLFCRAMPKLLDNSSLWQDLAVTHFWHAMEYTDKSRREELLKQGMIAARRALKLNPNKSSHWNILGAIAATDVLNQRALAQHAFIQALKLDPNCAVAWSNLGYVYYLSGDCFLANKAFSAAQSADHEYTNCWLGQALIAELLAPQESMDLFRHATSLTYHPGSCTGYADWVLKTLIESEKPKSTKSNKPQLVIEEMKSMHAVPLALDCMTWYTERRKDDVCAWNMFGLLLERQKMYRSSKRAFQEALLSAEQQKMEQDIQDMILCNLGRALNNCQAYDKAVEVFQKVKQASFASLSNLAFAFYKLRSFDKAYESYNTALQWLAPDDDTKSQVLIAMAAMQYSFTQLDHCKTLLFQSIELKPVSVYALFALCSIGLLHDDLTMAKVMLRELNEYSSDLRFMNDIILLEALSYMFQGDNKGALDLLAEKIFQKPEQASLWLTYAQLQILAYTDCNPNSIKSAANTALILGRKSLDVTKVQALVCVTDLISKNSKEASSSSQKAVWQFPEVAENWATLIATLMPLYSESGQSKQLIWLRDVVGHVRRKLEPSSSKLKKWLAVCDRRLTAACDMY